MGMLSVNPRGEVDCQAAIAAGTEKSLVKQSFADEVDINKIVARFQKTGMVTHLNEKQPFYGDVSHLVDLQHSLEVVANAQELFMGMSAQVRERFANDPIRMVAFLADEKNRPEAESLGIVLPKPVVPPVVAPVAPVPPAVPAPH